MKKLVAIALVACSLLTGSIALADTTASPIANAVRVAKPAPVKPIVTTVQHLSCKSQRQHVLVQGSGSVIVCEM